MSFDLHMHRPSLVAQVVKHLLANAGDPGSIPASGRSPGEGNGNPLEYSCLENSIDRRVWRAASPWGHKVLDMTKQLTHTYIWKKMWYEWIYNEILLSHKKEWNDAICSNMDGPREYHTEWSKSDRERQISYDSTYVWNLKNVIQINFFTKQK